MLYYFNPTPSQPLSAHPGAQYGKDIQYVVVWNDIVKSDFGGVARYLRL
jgi:hypothetical protein